jgi:hypothetical protein
MPHTPTTPCQCQWQPTPMTTTMTTMTAMHVVATMTPPAKLAQMTTNVVWAVLTTSSPTAPLSTTPCQCPWQPTPTPTTTMTAMHPRCRHHDAARKAGPNDDQCRLGHSVCFLVLYYFSFTNFFFFNSLLFTCDISHIIPLSVPQNKRQCS